MSVAAMRTAGMAVLAACGVLLAGCRGDADTEYKTTEYVFGTLVEITVRGVPLDKARAAVADLTPGFARMQKDWHAWKPGGELMVVNTACATGRPVRVSDFTLPLIADAKRFYALSDGLFDAAVGRIVAAWGFHADDAPRTGLPPLEPIKTLAAAHPSMDDVTIEGSIVTCLNPAVSLDFGGFAKGSALDWALARLAAAGIRNAVISAGGNVSTMGSHGDRPWRIGIRRPGKWDAVAGIDLIGGENLYTSGNYERFRDSDGVRYGHIIDPRTGMPVRHIVSVSVIHTSGALADAASTALTVAGLRDWPRIARRMGISAVLMIDEAGRLYASPDMARRLIFPDGQKPPLVVVPLP